MDIENYKSFLFGQKKDTIAKIKNSRANDKQQFV